MLGGGGARVEGGGASGLGRGLVLATGIRSACSFLLGQHTGSQTLLFRCCRHVQDSSQQAIGLCSESSEGI